ncbi:MAG: hypothetical protein QOD71_1175 [Thermoleophilaceae bacterium]|jgi:tetratricopeptide (TPR) repeat protein|nr:hypothetical protein [Thermoleophilaceae bacterium]
MSTQITAYRVFIASPGGLEGERNAFREVIQEYNELDALERGVIFLPLGWEIMPGGVGRPQAIINHYVRQSDYFVLALWKRWGSAPDVAEADGFSSASEEEFSLACECHAAQSMRQIVVLFKDVDSDLLKDPGPQLQRVLDFRTSLEREKRFFFERFEHTAAFRKNLRRQLAQWVRDHEEGGAAAPSPGARAPDLDIEAPAESPDEASSEDVRGAEQLVKEGRLVEAEQEFARAVGGNGDPALDTLLRYGRFLVEKGSLTHAEDTFMQLRDLARQRDRPGWVVASVNNLAKVYIAQGDMRSAEASYREALELRETTLGPDHGDVALSLNDLAQLYTSTRRLDEAEQLFKRALEIQGVDLDS